MGGLERPYACPVHSIRIVELGLLEQRFELGVRLQNPNGHAINIRGLEFSLDVNGQPFASGLSSNGVLLPEYGESVLAIAATSTLGSLLGQLESLSHRQELDYRLSGKLRLDRLLAPVPFDFSGKVPLQPPTSGPSHPDSI